MKIWVIWNVFELFGSCCDSCTDDVKKSLFQMGFLMTQSVTWHLRGKSMGILDFEILEIIERNSYTCHVSATQI